MVIPSKKINSLKSLYKTDSCNLDFTMQTCLILEKLQWPNYIAGVFSHFMAERKTFGWLRLASEKEALKLNRIAYQVSLLRRISNAHHELYPSPLLSSPPLRSPCLTNLNLSIWHDDKLSRRRCGRLYYKNIGCLGISELHCLVFLTVGSFVCVEMFSLGFVTSTSRYI